MGAVEWNVLYVPTTIRLGRDAIYIYRTDHSILYSGGWYPGIDVDHTPILNILLIALSGQGYNSLTEFFTASNAVGDDWQ